MGNIKIPAILAGISFLFIFIVNLAKGNSFGLVIGRSLLNGAVAFCLFFGLSFLIKNVFGIDFSDVSGSMDLTEEKSEVDVVIGDDGSENINANLDGFDDFGGGSTDPGQNEMMEPAPTVADSTGGTTGDSEMSEDLSGLAGNGLSDISAPDTSDLEGDSTAAMDEMTGAMDDDSVDISDSEIPEGASSMDAPAGYEDESLVESVKSQLGVDVTFEEVAKAIRTKLKDDG